MMKIAYLILQLFAVVYARNIHISDGKIYDGRIVNGTDAPPGKYPAMVSYQPSADHSCGGTILNENWVLTAAHCVDGDDVSKLSILAGTVDLYSTTEGSRHYVDQYIMHELYNDSANFNDIALVKVIEPFVWSSMVQPVALPAQNQSTAGGLNATVIGWGHPESGGDQMQFLQEVDYWTVSDAECSAVHSNTIYDTNICAYYPGGGKGQCNGDSGGPLWVNGQQVGIVSWSEKPCAVAPYPGVFTEVAPYIDWINSHINQK